MNTVLSKIARGITVCYAEVFPQVNEYDDYFHFSYEGKLFLIVDSYCMNPDCECQEVALHFVQAYPRESEKPASFMIRSELSGRGYTIQDHGNFRKREIKSIFTKFTSDNEPSTLFTERYKKMKQKAKEIINTSGAEKPKEPLELIYSKEQGFKPLRRNFVKKK